MDRPLGETEEALLQDTSTVVVAGAGDMSIFNSGAAHWAVNGNVDANAALYRGWLTAALAPHLCAAAVREQPFTTSEHTVGSHFYTSPCIRTYVCTHT